MGGLPAFISYGLMARLFFKLILIVVIILFGKHKAYALRNLLICMALELTKNTAVCAFAWLWGNVLWYIIPWFLTDFMFYLAVYALPVGEMLGVLFLCLSLIRFIVDEREKTD